MRCSALEFGQIGMAKFLAAYEVYCEANGIKLNDASEAKNSYTKYLELKHSLQPLLERNADKLNAARESVTNGNSGGTGR